VGEALVGGAVGRVVVGVSVGDPGTGEGFAVGRNVGSAEG